MVSENRSKFLTERHKHTMALDQSLCSSSSRRDATLGDRSPATLLRAEALDEIGPKVVSAARSFASDG
jgi:hypothetical protein